MKSSKALLPVSALAAALFLVPQAFAAVSAPSVAAIPQSVDATTYTLQITVDLGAKVTVVGGPSDLAPVTDGQSGDKADGKVKIKVGLAQEQDNVFSIIAEKAGVTSEATVITIHESAQVSAGVSAGVSTGGNASGSTGNSTTANGNGTPVPDKGDVTAPLAPILDPVPNPVAGPEVVISGSTEADANIYVTDEEGTRVASGRASAKGLFSIHVPLVADMTNTFNIKAEDAAYNMGPASQAVIQALDLSDADKAAIVFKGNPFEDVAGHWGENYILQLYEENVVSGKDAKHFDPDKQITRAELVKIALNAFRHQVDLGNVESSYGDVPRAAWFAAYVRTARDLDLAGGYADGFHPNAPITRAEALKILLKASRLNLATDSDTTFSDVPAKAWYATYVNYASSHGVVGGFADATFRPNDPITRAEVAKIVVNLQALVTESEK